MRLLGNQNVRLFAATVAGYPTDVRPLQSMTMHLPIYRLTAQVQPHRNGADIPVARLQSPTQRVAFGAAQNVAVVVIDDRPRIGFSLGLVPGAGQPALVEVF